MRRFWRAPFLVLALLSMVWGVWMGLLRLGWALPLPWPEQLILHGPLMIGGFLGTLIGLERAVGIARPWAYGAPLLTASGSVLLVFGPPGPFGPILITAGSAIVFAVFAVVLRRDTTLFAMTMMLAVVAWFIGNVQWAAGAAIYRVVFWWAGFLVLTIAGERLELNRLRRPSPLVRAAFVAAIVVLIAGLVALRERPEAGVRIVGAGLVALSVWLGAFDIARRTIYQPGIARFIAVCLLSGYVWLGIGGLTAIVTGASTPGTLYDAVLHTIFLGFVIAMIFGHAPIIFPAILGWPLPFRSAFYIHLAVLHASVALRVVGDFVDELGRWRAWGAAMNAVAIALFVVNTVAALVSGRR